MAEAVVTDLETLDELCINTVRVLSMEAVQQANSGHPGAPMALAPITYILWTKHLRHNPKNPNWLARDRFVLSCGHASMLLYSLLHLTGYDLSLEDIKNFRQWGSRTPGHPEFGATPGVETTTGPLGQGVANAVGMALAQARLAAEFGRPGHDVFDHWTYFLASDGDVMEGVSHEAASLAGHWKLGKLIGFYDENQITIDGATDLAMSDDTERRFEAYGWDVQRVEDGNDVAAIDRAISAAKASDKPSLIIVRTQIAYGSPNKQGTADSHGAPLGEEEVRLTKQNLGWEFEKAFAIPKEALGHWRRCIERGAALQAEWDQQFAAYEVEYPDLAAELSRRINGELPDGWDDALPTYGSETGPLATRAASGQALNAIAPALPELIGGSADLAGSNKTLVKGGTPMGRDDYAGRNVYFGVREHGMGSIANGMALHGGFLPYTATFLVFYDYMKPPIRLAALMGLKTIYVFSHDSIGVGEDGPTHQPIEMLANMRATPNVTVIRPADANETAEAWRAAIKHHGGPVVLSLTRQKVPTIDRTRFADAAGLSRGAYVLADAANGKPEAIIIASGSEVGVALDARERLDREGLAVRVVSMPCMEFFADQPTDYQEEVLPSDVTARVAVEAGHPMPWYRWVGEQGDIVALDHFGASAPGKELFQQYGFTGDAVAARVKGVLAR
ncbi:MAG: transketolase [Gemmatimonadota bacterium]|nr:MAG: transketolase [Gemmatimonadota bacterium]